MSTPEKSNQLPGASILSFIVMVLMFLFIASCIFWSIPIAFMIMDKVNG